MVPPSTTLYCQFDRRTCVVPDPFLYLPTHSILATSSYAIPMYPGHPVEQTTPNRSNVLPIIAHHQFNRNSSSYNWNSSSLPCCSVSMISTGMIQKNSACGFLLSTYRGHTVIASRSWPFRFKWSFIPLSNYCARSIIIIHFNVCCSNLTFCLLLDFSVLATALSDG